MDFQELVDQKKQTIVERWDKYNLLQGIQNEEKKVGTAVLLENQRLFNEQYVDHDNQAQFKRLSIPFVRRIAPNLAAWEFVSVQPLLMTKDYFHYFKGNKLVREAIEAKEWKMRTRWSYEGFQDLRSANNLDAEAEMCAVLSQELTLEHDRRILDNLRKDAAIKKFVDFNELYGNSTFAKYITLQQVLKDLSEEIRITSKRGAPTWLCTSQEMAEAVAYAFEDKNLFTNSLGIHKYGMLHDSESLDETTTVWVDPLMKVGQVIMGYRGEHPYDAGYAFCPHLLVKRTPVVLDPNSFMPHSCMMGVAGSGMTDPTCYGVLEVENFIQPN